MLIPIHKSKKLKSKFTAIPKVISKKHKNINAHKTNFYAHNFNKTSEMKKINQAYSRREKYKGGKVIMQVSLTKRLTKSQVMADSVATV